MDTEAVAARQYRVVCAWCGAFIRLREGKDSEGMCSDCFRRLFDGHARPQANAKRAGKASDR